MGGGDFLGVDNLLAEIILALGAALAVGMGMALFGPALRRRYGLADPTSDGRAPVGTGNRLTGRARVRAIFLFLVGLTMTGWGLASVLSG